MVQHRKTGHTIFKRKKKILTIIRDKRLKPVSDSCITYCEEDVSKYVLNGKICENFKVMIP